MAQMMCLQPQLTGYQLPIGSSLVICAFYDTLTSFDATNQSPHSNLEGGGGEGCGGSAGGVQLV